MRKIIFLILLLVSGCIGEETKVVTFLTDFSITQQDCVKTISGQRCKEVVYFVYEGKSYNKTLGWIITEDCNVKCGFGISDQTLLCIEKCNKENRNKPKPSDRLNVIDGKIKIKAIYNLTSKTLSNIDVIGLS